MYRIGTWKEEWLIAWLWNISFWRQWMEAPKTWKTRSVALNTTSLPSIWRYVSPGLQNQIRRAASTIKKNRRGYSLMSNKVRSEYISKTLVSSQRIHCICVGNNHMLRWVDTEELHKKSITEIYVETFPATTGLPIRIGILVGVINCSSKILVISLLAGPSNNINFRDNLFHSVPIANDAFGLPSRGKSKIDVR